MDVRIKNELVNNEETLKGEKVRVLKSCTMIDRIGGKAIVKDVLHQLSPIFLWNAFFNLFVN